MEFIQNHLILVAVLVMVVVAIVVYLVRKYKTRPSEVEDDDLADLIDVEVNRKLPEQYKQHQLEADPFTINKVADNLPALQPQVEESKQQGEEEYQAIKQDSENMVVNDVKTSVESTSSSHEIASEVENLITQDYKPKTLEEKLDFTYYFHSKPFDNAHRYSAAGRFEKVEVSEEYPAGYKLVVGYAVVGNTPDKETKKVDVFSRAEGRRIAESKLRSEKTSYNFPVTEEQLQTPGRTFGDIVKGLVPFTVLDTEDRHTLRSVYADPKMYVLVDDATGLEVEPTVEETAERDAYIEAIKKADYSHLMAKINVEQCSLCNQYILGVEGLEVFTNSPTDETTPTIEDTSVVNPTDEFTTNQA